jgi:hypothetical protein
LSEIGLNDLRKRNLPYHEVELANASCVREGQPTFNSGRFLVQRLVYSMAVMAAGRIVSNEKKRVASSVVELVEAILSYS